MNNNEKTLVLGLGNVLMGDEGIGVYVVRELEEQTLPAGVECLDGGTGGFTLLEIGIALVVLVLAFSLALPGLEAVPGARMRSAGA